MRTERRNLVNAIKIATYNAERLLARRFFKHYKDPRDWLTFFRSILQLPGTIANRSTDEIVVELRPPDEPKVRSTQFEQFPACAGSDFSFPRPSSEPPRMDSCLLSERRTLRDCTFGDEHSTKGSHALLVELEFSRSMPPNESVDLWRS